MRKRLTLLAAAVLALLAIAGSAPTFGAPPGGGGGGACTPAPQLKAVTINQGLGSYTRLIRGKSTLFRAYLGESCGVDVGASIQVETASLRVKNGSTVLTTITPAPSPLGPTFPLVTITGSPTAPDGPADLKFVIPGSVLAQPQPPASSYTASFELTVGYRSSPSAGAAYSPAPPNTPTPLTFTTLTGSKSLIAKTVETRTNSLRVLGVPMFLPLTTGSYDLFVGGMATLARIFPVPEGVTNDLSTTSGGLRYAINAVPIDATGLLNSSNKFCGTGSNFATVKTRLAERLGTWNAGNSARTTLNGGVTSGATSITVNGNDPAALRFPPTFPFEVSIDNEIINVTGVSGTTWTVERGRDGTTAAAHSTGATVVWGYPADRVVGIVNEADSLGSPGCVEGMASVTTPESYVRALPDRIGALVGIEVAHTFGAVPASRSDGGYHSIHTNADWLAGDADRAYHITPGSATFLANDKSVMRYAATGWTDTNTVLEQGDYGFIACKLGGATTSDCSTAGSTGTPEGVAASLDAPVAIFTMTGHTDNTQAGTKVKSGQTLGYPSDPVASEYRVVQKVSEATSTPERTDQVLVSFTDSIHGTGPDEDVTNTDGSFDFAVPYDADASHIEFWNGVPDATPNDTGPIRLWQMTKSAPPVVSPAPVITVASTSETFETTQAESITPVDEDATGATTIANAIVKDESWVTSASFDAAPPSGTPNGTSDKPLTSFPTDADDPTGRYGILTSGDVNLADEPNEAGNSGADDGGGTVSGRGDTARDVTVLKIDLTAPAGSNCLTVDFQFLSEEFSEYVGSQFNDAFVAELDTSNWTTSGSTISAPNNFAFDSNGKVVSVNSSGPTAMSSENAAGTTYDGATALLSAATPISEGAHTLYLSIFDQGDNVYDSAVFIDNVVIGLVPEGECEPGAKPAKPPPQQQFEFEIEDPDTPCSEITYSVYASVPGGPRHVLADNVPCGTNSLESYTAKWGGQGVIYEVSAGDGWSQTPPAEVAESTIDTEPQSPVATIVAPDDDSDGADYNNLTREYDGLTLIGEAWDFQEKITGDANYTWSSDPAPCGLTGSSALFAGTLSGKMVKVESSTGLPLPTGTFCITLKVTDSDGNFDETFIKKIIFEDVEHDNIPGVVDPSACDPFDPGDDDTLNFKKDTDGDGIPDGWDFFTVPLDVGIGDAGGACTPATMYSGSADFTPKTFLVNSVGTAVNTAKVPFRDLRQITPSSVKIVAIDGKSLASPISPVPNGVSALKDVLTAKFSRAPFNAYFTSHPELIDRNVSIVMTGSAPAIGTAPAWDFTVESFTFVIDEPA